MDKRREPRRGPYQPDGNRFRGPDFNPAWVKVLAVNPLPKLIRHEKPFVTLSVLRDLYDLNYLDDLYKAAEGEVFRQHSWRIVFKPTRQPAVGDSSPEKERGVAFNFLQQLHRMHRIMELGGTTHLPPVKSEIVKLMKFQAEDGRFPLLYHHHAHACWILLKLGMEGNRLLDKGIHWILERQRGDGGWLHRSMTPKGKKYDDAESCIWTTAEVLQLLSCRKSIRKSDQAGRACEFLLERLLQRNKTALFPTVEAWDHLAIGSKGDSIFSGGTLKVMEAVTRCGYDRKDQRLNKLYKWLLSIQLEGGYFPRIAGKFPVADSMVTVRALAVIKNLPQV
ncbi:MAG: hypothetical protein GXO91_05100 [FCB group bacterium]|nr:hypothetical protein [FCB group bacterium]